MKYRSSSAALFLIATCIAFSAGCSKPVAPTADLSPDRMALAATADTASFLRLVFDTRLAPSARSDRRRERPGEFVLTISAYPPPFVHGDTIPAHSALKRVQWWRKDSLGWSMQQAPLSTVRLAPGVDSTLLADLPAGVARFRVARPAAFGGGRADFRMFVGLVPVEWWSGPDPRRWPLSPDRDGRAVEIRDWSRFTTTSGAWPPDGRGWFGPDSFAYRPLERRPLENAPERATFWEIRGNRIYAHFEGDTVRLGSTLVFSHGGYDADSPYLPHVVAGDPALPSGWQTGRRDRLLQADGVVGSPIATRAQVFMRLDNGQISMPSETTSYPWFDPASVYRRPSVHFYFRPVYTAKHYVLARSEDGDGSLGPPWGRYASTVGVMLDHVDGVGDSDLDRELRRRVLVFHVKP